MLKLYARVVCIQTPTQSVGKVTLRLSVFASVVDPLLKTKVGHCLSILIDHIVPVVVSTFPTVSVL